MSPCALLLWMSGDSRIQHALATGLTTIDLWNPNELAFCLFPKLLQNLRALRTLKVDRIGYPLPCMNDIRETVRNLSPTLREIKICAEGVGRFFATSSAPSSSCIVGMDDSKCASASTAPLWRMKTAFPLLESLKLDSVFAFTPEDLLDLPESLTTLNTRMSGFDDTIGSHTLELEVAAKFTCNLPRNLTTLKASGIGVHPSHYIHLPPTLTYFQNTMPLGNRLSTSLTTEEIATLPRTLERHIGVLPNFLSSTELAHLPRSLKNLTLRKFKDDTDRKGLQVDFGRLFPQLKSLNGNILCTSYILRYMPLTLVSLSARIDLDSIQVGDWPQSLTKLNIEPINFSPKLQLLPPTIKILKITTHSNSRGIESSQFAFIPPSVLSLSCDCKKIEDTVLFPPNLTRLRLGRIYRYKTWTGVDCGAIRPREDSDLQEFDLNNNEHLEAMKPRPKLTRCFPFEKIPKSVSELNLECAIPASQLKYLPRRLKLLCVVAIFEDDAFDPLATCENDALAEIRSVGRTEGILLEEDSRPPPDATAMMIALLPRTLRTLDIFVSAFSNDPSTEWCRELPPRIQTMSLSGSSLHPDFVFKAPLQHIHQLDVSLKYATDDHIKALPRKTSFITIEAQSKLTHMAAAYLPHYLACLDSYSFGYAQLSNERRKHAQDQDPSVLRALYGTNKEDFEFLRNLPQ